VKANSACASKLPPNPKKGINTVFNHFRDKPARYVFRFVKGKIVELKRTLNLLAASAIGLER